MPEWVKFDGSEEQLEMMRTAEHGFKIKYKNNIVGNQDESSIIIANGLQHAVLNHVTQSSTGATVTHFLICEPHPHAEMIIEWARTGRPVYFFDTASGEWLPVKKPDWDENTRYSFDPPKEKIKYRVALFRDEAGTHYTNHTNTEDGENLIQNNGHFVRWLGDWQEVEV